MPVLPVDVREQFGMIERNIALEARLIDDLFDITAISQGKLQLRAEYFDVHSLIGMVIQIVSDSAAAKNITIECNLAASRSGLLADPTRFQQVIWNLLRNAVKFTPAGGRVKISTSERTNADGQPWLHLEIIDSGIGIEPESLVKILSPFEQGAITGDHRFGGMGLGLAIARAIVDLHNGKIWAESRGLNQGSIFVVEFPGVMQPPSDVSESSILSVPVLNRWKMRAWSMARSAGF